MKLRLADYCEDCRRPLGLCECEKCGECKKTFPPEDLEEVFDKCRGYESVKLCHKCCKEHYDREIKQIDRELLEIDLSDFGLNMDEFCDINKLDKD